VFLALAALYESWSIPLAMMLVVPICLLGAMVAAWLFGQSNDVYFKAGMLASTLLSVFIIPVVIVCVQSLLRVRYDNVVEAGSNHG